MYIYIILLIKFGILLIPLELLYLYKPINNIYKILFYLFLIRQTINLIISDYLFRIFVPIKYKNTKINIKTKKINYLNEEIYLMIEPIEVQTIDISLKIKYYISYLYLFLIIYLLIFSYNNKFLNIYFKGYIHGNLYYINKDFSLKNILKYKPYFILLGIIDYYSSFNIKFISLKFIISYLINYLLDYYPYIHYFFNKKINFKKTFNINIIIILIWNLSLLISNGSLNKNHNSFLFYYIYLFIKKIKNINSLILNVFLWKEYRSLNNLLNYGPLIIYTRPKFNDILYYSNELMKITNYKTIKLFYFHPIITDFIIYFMYIDKKIANIFKDTKYLNLVLNEFIQNISKSLNESCNNKYESFNFYSYIDTYNYIIIDNYFN